MHERVFTHERRSLGDTRRVRTRRHPQLLLECLVQKKGAKLLTSPRQVEKIPQVEIVVYLANRLCVNGYPQRQGPLWLTSNWTSTARSGRVFRRPFRATRLSRSGATVLVFSFVFVTTGGFSATMPPTWAALADALVVRRGTTATGSASPSVRCFWRGGITTLERGWWWSR